MTGPANGQSAILLEAASRVASYSLQDPRYPEVELSQAEHRIRLVNAWHIDRGSRVLEIGCGQGNCTAVLAEAVGPSGHIDAVDPAPPNYGAPFTLGQAQEFLGAGVVGERITWHRKNVKSVLDGTEKTWDVAVLAHSIWYFKTEEVLRGILEALKGRVTRICVAEYALAATNHAALPHVFAALTRGMLEAYKDESSENIRTPISPARICELAKDAGWEMGSPTIQTIVPEPGLRDGAWEVGTVVSGQFVEEIERAIGDERVRSMVRTMRDVACGLVKPGEKLRTCATMDVWVGELVEATALCVSGTNSS